MPRVSAPSPRTPHFHSLPFSLFLLSPVPLLLLSAHSAGKIGKLYIQTFTHAQSHICRRTARLRQVQLSPVTRHTTTISSHSHVAPPLKKWKLYTCMHTLASTPTATQTHSHILAPLSLLGNLFTECWAHLRENLIETGANLMMARSGGALGPASPPVRLHLVVLTLNTLLLHFMPHASMQRCPLIHATLIVNPTFDMHRAHSILILFFLFVSSLPPLVSLPTTYPTLPLSSPLSSSRMDITPTDRRRKAEWTATTRTLCPKTLRT